MNVFTWQTYRERERAEMEAAARRRALARSHRIVRDGYVIPSDAVQAVGRFRPEGPIGYRARPPYAPADAPIRATRGDALADILPDTPKDSSL